jgi:hypothetical protein
MTGSTAERRFVWCLVTSTGQALDLGYYRLPGVAVLGPPWPSFAWRADGPPLQRLSVVATETLTPYS